MERITHNMYNDNSTPFALDVRVMGRRVVATFLDFIPLGLLILLINSTFGVDQYLSSLKSLPGIPYSSSTSVAWPWLYLVMILYYTVQEALFSTTIGKFIMGLRVVQDDGSPITLMEALIRNIVRPIDAVSGYLVGWLVALSSSRRRRLGDHLARTVVAGVDSVPAFSPRRSRFRLYLSILVIVCASFIVFCLVFRYYGRPPLVMQSLTHANASSQIFTQYGTVTDLVLSQPRWQDNTVMYNFTFHAFNHSASLSCQGDITLIWRGFLDGWSMDGGSTACNPMVLP